MLHIYTITHIQTHIQKLWILNSKVEQSYSNENVYTKSEEKKFKINVCYLHLQGEKMIKLTNLKPAEDLLKQHITGKRLE